MKNIHECKDEVALSFGHGSWDLMRYRCSPDVIEDRHNKAAKLYAEEAVKADRERIFNTLANDHNLHLIVDIRDIVVSAPIILE